MTNLIFSKALSMHVTTYEILNDRGRNLVLLLNELFDFILDYINSDKLEIHFELMNGKQRTLKFNKKNLNMAYDHLLQGNMQRLIIFYPAEYEGNSSTCDSEFIYLHYPSLFKVAIGCNLAATYPKHFINNFFNDFNISLNERLFNNYIHTPIQTKFIELFKKAIVSLKAVTGYITYESESVDTPMTSTFEDHWGLNIFQLPGYTHRLRGYHWANYLSQQHVEILGGLDFIQRNAPCPLVETITNHEHLGVYLQLTKDVNDYSDENLIKLRKFLWPLLNVDENKFEVLHGKPRIINYESGRTIRLVEPHTQLA
ncbi:hypothetical protein ACFQ3W_14060 [Paenibacillus puldeungensis]|uniref:Uncharacterized protein n=1 Tax=Paenibacillus puldeungensis TaxID=696536 RepID=A0ABW3RZX2_9BACL